MGIVILIAVAVVTLLLFLHNRSGGKKEKLWNKCRQLLNLPFDEADKTIERYMKSLEGKHPGKSEEWYLEKIIYDLERDR